MANTITRGEKYANMLDEVIVHASKTGLLSTPEDLKAEFVGVGTVKVPKITMSALGNYSKADGFPAGTVTYDYETFTLAYDRGREFMIDAMDDEETNGNVVPAVLAQFARTKVVPEVDAVRIARYATGAGKVVKDAAPTSSNIAAKFDAIVEYLDELGHDPADGILFVRPAVKQLLKGMVNREFGMEEVISRKLAVLDDIKIESMPSTRMKTAITVGSDGWAAHEDAVDVWAIFVPVSGVRQIAKHEKMRTFAPDVNQAADATKIQYRLYHDAVVLANKAAAIYCLQDVDAES